MPADRIRQDVNDPSGCSIMVVGGGSQLGEGAARTAVEIAQELVGSRDPSSH